MLSAQGIEVDRRGILIDQPIRTLGDHPVRVRLHADVIASLNVKVVSEDKMHLVEEEAAEPRLKLLRKKPPNSFASCAAVPFRDGGHVQGGAEWLMLSLLRRRRQRS